MAERKAAATSRGKRAPQPGPPRTLIQAHEALVRIRPKGNASLAAWKAYYERSAALYLEIAEIDRGHHHEALYWAQREQEKATEIAARISAGASPKQLVPDPEWSR
ncbi:MAG: AMED_5909 family protein [Pseudonocardiaceae bacterium]